jgi:hypothetical protein
MLLLLLLLNLAAALHAVPQPDTQHWHSELLSSSSPALCCPAIRGSVLAILMLLPLLPLLPQLLRQPLLLLLRRRLLLLQQPA